MEIRKYRVCGDLGCELYEAVVTDIEDGLDLENVRINPETGELSFDNPRNCQVDERKLEEAARRPDRHIEFEVCE